MKFKGIAIPPPSKGTVIAELDQVVPDQSMSLKEILTRFVRKEPLPVGHQGSYGSDSGIDPERESPFNIDVEKARHWDLTEKDDFKAQVAARGAELEGLKKAGEAKKAADKAAKDKKDFDRKVRLEAKKQASKNPPNGGSI